VLIFYMALKHIEEIVNRLITGGCDPHTPAALIAHATTETQTIVETDLAGAVAASRGISPPALFVVGEVVRLRSGLDWIGALGGRVLESDPLGQRDDRDVG
jgi:uroporphyrin-III C-methyltransferase